MPTFRHGKAQKFQLDNSAGTLTDLSSYINNVSFPRSVDTGETTAFGNSAKTYIPGLQDATISVEGMFDSTVDAHIVALIAALDSGSLATASYEYKANNAATSATNPAFQGESIVTSYEVSAAVGDVVTFKLELQCSGAITRATS